MTVTSEPLPTSPRVLLIAEAANPEWVSVPLVGWSIAQALARKTNVHLVTQVRNRDAILRAGLVEGRDFTAIDSEALNRPIHFLREHLRGGKGKGWTTAQAFGSLVYPYFEHLVWKTFRKQLANREFDLVHRVIPLSPTTPSPIASHCKRIGVPFLLGPLNGGLPWPPGFDAVRRQEKEWLSYIRSLYKLQPGTGSTRRHAAAILAASISTWNELPRSAHEKCFYIPENAVDPARFRIKRTRQATRPIKCVFLGRLVPYKGADMLLEAAAPLVREGALTIDIIGDGPQMPELRQIITREHLENGVTLRGWVEHSQLVDNLVEFDLLTFPSIREFGGGVVLEAMAIGLVPLIVDYGGPAELATNQTGYLIPLGNRDQIITHLRDTLTRIAADPSQIEPKSQAAIKRVERHFTWEAKADQILDVYRWVLGQSPDKPLFPMPLPDESES